ncbi:MAG: UbiA family prenyltransferase [Firmicutes bacterium]|nr:UbiA family prenyltransferase [Bacillota bacterium]
MIDIGHSLFALPFAYLGALLAARGIPTLHQLAWITLAMVSARTAALGLNRLIDRHIDARNPRTADWILPRGLVRLPVVVVAIVVSFLVMLYSAAQLNELCLKLAPLAVIALTAYSYTKRFTWTANVILGLTIGLGPVGAWLAVSPRLEVTPLLLWLAVGLWIAGFDTMYACQDENFDLVEGLHSIPARFGTAKALDIAAWFHTMTVLLLLAVGFKMGLGWPYYIGVVIAALVLRFEHRLVSADDLSRMHTAAFGINRYVSAILLLFALLSYIKF